MIAFVVLRASNLYGDPAPWRAQAGVGATILSFINCEKYPPSLLYLAMTIGPALLLLAAVERARGPFAEWITTYGRVPFFYYVSHIFLIHALAVVFAWASGAATGWLFGPFPADKPSGYGLGASGRVRRLACSSWWRSIRSASGLPASSSAAATGGCRISSDSCGAATGRAMDDAG